MTDGHPSGRHAAAGAIPWLFGGALIVVAVFGIAFAVLLTGNSASSGPRHHKQQALAAASPPEATTPIQSLSPVASASPHKKSPSAVPSPARITTPPVTTHQQPSNGSATVRLTTTVTAGSWNHSQGGGWVAFQVDNTGSAAAGQVTVTITLPAGASMAGGGGGGGGGGDASLSSFTTHSHWNCQPTSTGATCTLASLAAGSKAGGAIYFTVSGGSVCSQPVDLTAVSGSASSSAQSSIAC